MPKLTKKAIRYGRTDVRTYGRTDRPGASKLFILGGVKWRAKRAANFFYPPQNFYPGGKICLGGVITPPEICWQG